MRQRRVVGRRPTTTASWSTAARASTSGSRSPTARSSPPARCRTTRWCPSLLTLSDVMGTGHHAAVAAGVRRVDTVVVVGDGAVGLCGVLAAPGWAPSGSSRCRATRPGRRSPASSARPTSSRSAATRRSPRIKELTAGVGADAVLECVGTNESMEQAIASARPGGTGRLRRRAGGWPELPIRDMFARTSASPAASPRSAPTSRSCSPTCSTASLNPGAVFDLELPLAEVAEAYRAMDERRRSRPCSGPDASGPTVIDRPWNWRDHRNGLTLHP